jgi:hypothetical protein
MDCPVNAAPGRLKARLPMLHSAGRVACTLALAVLLASGLSGCQIVIGVLMLLQGKPTVPARFDSETRLSLAEKGKKVVVLCTSSMRAQAEHPSLDIDIITEVSRRLEGQNIDVVDSFKVARWIDDNGELTEKSNFEKLGKQFDADYIVLIRIEEFGFREGSSTQLFRGHALGTVSVMLVKEADGRSWTNTIFSHPIDSKYPLHQPLTAEESPESFKQRYLSRFGEELARLFYEHAPGDDI